MYLPMSSWLLCPGKALSCLMPQAPSCYDAGLQDYVVKSERNRLSQPSSTVL